MLGGSIDLLLRLDDENRIVDASVIDFKTIDGGPHPETRPDWTELALQVQLYARAATDVLDANAHTGAVHLLRDGHRIAVPVDQEAVEAAVRNVEWAAERIIASDFPMRPRPDKCRECDWRRLCSQVRGEFAMNEVPPPLRVPRARPVFAGPERSARYGTDVRGIRSPTAASANRSGKAVLIKDAQTNGLPTEPHSAISYTCVSATPRVKRLTSNRLG